MLDTLITLLVGCWLIARDVPASDAEGAWLAVEGRGILLWKAGQVFGLVGKFDRSWAFTAPMRGGSGLIADYKHDLNRLRSAAHPPKCPNP